MAEDPGSGEHEGTKIEFKLCISPAVTYFLSTSVSSSVRWREEEYLLRGSCETIYVSTGFAKSLVDNKCSLNKCYVLASHGEGGGRGVQDGEHM